MAAFRGNSQKVFFILFLLYFQSAVFWPHCSTTADNGRAMRSQCALQPNPQGLFPKNNGQIPGDKVALQAIRDVKQDWHERSFCASNVFGSPLSFPYFSLECASLTPQVKSEILTFKRLTLLEWVAKATQVKVARIL